MGVLGLVDWWDENFLCRDVVKHIEQWKLGFFFPLSGLELSLLNELTLDSDYHGKISLIMNLHTSSNLFLFSPFLLSLPARQEKSGIFEIWQLKL